MQGRWFARLFFAVVGALAVAGVVSGTACTRWGQPGPGVPTIAPLASIYVDASTGSDTTGNGSMSKPYKTLTKAVAVLSSAKSFSPAGVVIYLASGDYNTANGEKFPIVIPTNVTLTGMNYGSGPRSGSFIDGLGEDTIFEHIVHAPARTAYTTLEIAPPATVGVSEIYVGASRISLPSRAAYVSLDDLATLSGSTASFGAGIVTSLTNVSGVLVPGGSFTCASCQIHGNDFGIGALSVPVATASPYATAPTITLSHSVGDSTISAKIVDLLTDGSVNVTASGEAFEQGRYAYCGCAQSNRLGAGSWSDRLRRRRRRLDRLKQLHRREDHGGLCNAAQRNGQRARRHVESEPAAGEPKRQVQANDTVRFRRFGQERHDT